MFGFSPAPPEKEDNVNVVIHIMGIGFSYLCVGMFECKFIIPLPPYRNPAAGYYP